MSSDTDHDYPTRSTVAHLLAHVEEHEHLLPLMSPQNQDVVDMVRSLARAYLAALLELEIRHDNWGEGMSPGITPEMTALAEASKS